MRTLKTYQNIFDVVTVVFFIGMFLVSAFQQNPEAMKEAAGLVVVMCLINVFFYGLYRVWK